MELINKEDVIREISLLRLPDDDTNYCVKAYNDAIERSQEVITQISVIESRPECTWEVTSTFPREWICSNCGTHYSERLTHKKHNYCAVCGAESIRKEEITERTSTYENNRKGKA